MNRHFKLASADLVVPNLEAWALLWDFTTLRELVETLPGNTSLQNKALNIANEIMNVFHKGDPSHVKRARMLAEEVLGKGWESKGASIYDEGAKRAQIWGIGYEIKFFFLMSVELIYSAFIAVIVILILHGSYPFLPFFFKFY
jgi:alpha-mannosidase